MKITRKTVARFLTDHFKVEAIKRGWKRLGKKIEVMKQSSPRLSTQHSPSKSQIQKYDHPLAARTVSADVPSVSPLVSQEQRARHALTVFLKSLPSATPEEAVHNLAELESTLTPILYKEMGADFGRDEYGLLINKLIQQDGLKRKERKALTRTLKPHLDSGFHIMSDIFQVQEMKVDQPDSQKSSTAVGQLSKKANTCISMSTVLMMELFHKYLTEKDMQEAQKAYINRIEPDSKNIKPAFRALQQIDD